MLNLNKELQEIPDKFLQMLKGDFPEIDLGKLKNIFEGDWGNFVNTLKKQKISLSGELKDDWFDRFNSYKQKADNIKSSINTTDKQIDTLVYKLYDLTDDEIKIVEDSLKAS